MATAQFIRINVYLLFSHVGKFIFCGAGHTGCPKGVNLMPKTVNIDTAMAEFSIAVDHLGEGIRQLAAIHKNNPLDSDKVEHIRQLESQISGWLIDMEDFYQDGGLIW